MHKQTCQDLRLTHASLKGFKDKLSYHIPEQLQAWVMETMDISVSDASNHIMMALDSKRCGPKGKGIWFLDPISIFSKLATSQASWYANLTTTIVSCLTWCAMQSTHLFSLKVPLRSFLLLLNWKGLNANAYMQILREHPEHCTI